MPYLCIDNVPNQPITATKKNISIGVMQHSLHHLRFFSSAALKCCFYALVTICQMGLKQSIKHLLLV
ncbi:hypothetical protein XELAEV_18025062mg [Xenopus laevis]|uniref:Uncharacterized protein n=1 Tax=Xenopus laevis TaxID=8355 RepID=A0A974D1N3_XENLA|nr:hypothetical protein XELAEV_18025062mg [Xenopus laevis]